MSPASHASKLLARLGRLVVGRSDFRSRLAAEEGRSRLLRACRLRSRRWSDPQGLEALETRTMLAGNFHSDRVSFMADVRVGQVAGVDFDTIPAGTDLSGVGFGGVTFGAPGAPLVVIDGATGVRNAMTPSSGTRVLSPGGSNASLEDDDLEIIFDRPIQAAGMDVVLDVPDGASYTSVTFYDAAGAVLYTSSMVPAPAGSPGYQFVGYVSAGDDIKRIVFDEYDPSPADDHVAYDSLVFTTLTSEVEPVSYDMPNGQSGSYNYWDNTYSGSGNRSLSGAALNGGLGQLTDDRIGTSTFAANLTFGPAWEWVAWQGITPTITFDFGQVVSLDGASIHISNHRGDCSIFGSAVAQFSNDGITYGDTYTYTTSASEYSDTAARFVDLVFQRQARFVKLTLNDGNLPWLAISEVDFFQLAQPPLIDLDFNSGVDGVGASIGDLVYNGAGGLQVTFTDDESAGSEGGNAGGVHITNAGYGNRRAGSGDLVLGAYNDTLSEGVNRHSSGIVARFNRGVEGVSLVDADDDTTTKTLFAYDKFGKVIGQTTAGSQRTFSITTADTGGRLIYSVEFDTAAGTAGGSNDGTYFTIDDFRVVGTVTVPPEPDRVLFVSMGGGYTADGVNFHNTLIHQGYSADYVVMNSPGKVVTALTDNSYDQVWVYDLNSGELPATYDADLFAIGDWYKAKRAAGERMNLITDGRIISSYWSGRWTDEGRRLTANYYENLRAAGDGGLVLSTDHNAFHQDINVINARINIEPFTGNFSLATIPVDRTHPLMTMPNDMGAVLFDDSSPGQTPYGLQPNGQILYTVAWHSGNVNTPGISSTISGTVGFDVEISSPASGTGFLHGQAVTLTATQANGTGPFTYTWSSNRDGALGAGQTLAVNTLSLGSHTITLLGEDSGGGGADTASITVNVLPVADLVPSAVGGPAKADPGDTISLTYTLTNSGSADAAGFSDRVYLSADATFDPADTLLKTYAPVASLAAGASVPVAVDVVLPELPYGDYHLFIVSNETGAVAEVDKTDNVAAAIPIALVDLTAPTVVSFEPVGYRNSDVSEFVVRFSEAIDAATFTAADVVVKLPDDSVLPAAQLAVSQTAPDQFTVALAAALSAEGRYGVTVGPLVADLAGNTMQPLTTAVVYGNDFEAAVGAEWNVSGRYSYTGMNVLGRYLNSPATLQLSGLGGHVEVMVKWDLHLFGSWDGNNPTYGFDYFGWSVDGRSEPEWEHTFTDHQPQGHTYPGTWSRQVSGVEIYDGLTHTFSHSGSTLDLHFRGRNLTDEDWGIDNLSVTITGSAGGGSGHAFMIDKTGPTVSNVSLGASQLQVTYADLSGVDPATATDVNNYALVASGGDGTFGDGNEVAINLAGRVSGAVLFNSTTQTATLNLNAALPDEVYRLTVKGSATVRDLAGNALLGGSDYVSGDLAVNAVASTVAIDLQGGSDSGVSATDDLTNAGTPVFDISVNEAGVIGLDVDDDGIAEVTQAVLAGGTYSLGAPAPVADGARDAKATFTPLAGTGVSASVVVTYDRQGPVASDNGNSTEQAPLAGRGVKFNEVIDSTSLTIADVALTGPGGAVGVLAISGTGDSFAVLFDPITSPGTYQLTLGPAVSDRAGNAMAEELVATFEILADTTRPRVVSSAPEGLVNTSVSNVRLTFDELIDAASFTSADLLLGTPVGPVDSGSIAVTPVLPSTSSQTHVFDVSFPTQSADGTYTLAVGPAITDLSGNAMGTAQSVAWTIDRTGPRITFAEPALLGDELLDHIDFRFDSVINGSTLTVADASLMGPGGAIAISGISQVGATTYRASFAAQSAPGGYQLSIGPGVFDAAGNAMDQDADGTPGEGGQDEFAHTVTIADLVGPYVVVIAPVQPVNTAVSSLRVKFNEAINPASFEVADVAITGPGGHVTASGIVAVDARTFDIAFAPQTANGRYIATIGPGIMDLAGNLMAGGDRAYATRLVFEPAVADGSPVPAAYGDRVAAASGGGFNYGGGSVIPFTPGVVVDYSANLRRAGSGFGSLNNVVYPATGNSFDITLTADPGELVALHGFDLAASGGGDATVRQVQVVGADGAVLAAYSDVLVEGDSGGAGFTRIDLGEGLIGSRLTVRIVADNLGSSASIIGLDNLVFSQVGAAAAIPAAAFRSGFTIDTTGPSVVSVSPSGVVTSFFDQFDVNFDGLIDPASFSVADVAIVGPGGSIVPASVLLVGGTRWRVVLAGAATANGTYQVLIGPNVLDLLGNPMSAASVTAVDLQLADLEVSRISVPAGGLFGRDLLVEWTVRNLTPYSSTATWSDDIYLSRDNVFDGSDELLKSISAAEHLPVGGNSAYSRSVSVPLPLRVDLADGAYFIFVKTNPTGSQNEPDANNNVSLAGAVDLVTPDVPNLVVSDIVAPADARAGDTITVSWTVSNIGQADFTGVFEDRVYLSPDGVIGGDTAVVTVPFAGTLLKNTTVSRSTSITLPWNSDADRWIVVMTDATALVNEHSNEGDNTAIDDQKIDITFPPLPDLKVELVQLSGPGQSGQPLKIDWDIRNIGDASAPTSWADRLVVRNATTGQTILDESISWSEQAFQGNEIIAGQAMAGTYTLTLPDGPKGIGDIVVTLSTDASDVIFEGLAEGNNAGSASITTTSGPVADVRAVSVTGPGTQVWAGRSIAVSWQVASEGEKSAAGNWVDRIYLRPSGGGEDIAIGSAANPKSLPVGDVYLRSGMFVVPAGLSGEFRPVVRANYDGGLYEVDLADNLVVGDPFTILIPPDPDMTVTQVLPPEMDVKAGGLAQVRWTVRNDGAAPTDVPRWYDRVYLSADTTLDGADFLLDPLVENPRSLAVGESYEQSHEFVIPPVALGRYHVIVAADWQGHLPEVDESNNRFVSEGTFEVLPVVPARLEVADLVVVPSNPWRGDEVMLQWRLVNTGELATGPLSFDHTIVLSDNDTLEQSIDRPLRFHIAKAELNLGPGQKSGVLSATVPLPIDVLGEKHLIVWVDPPNWADVARTHGAVEVSIQPGVPSDLVVDRVTAPTNAMSGFPIHVSWSVRNASVQTTRAGQWHDRVILSADADAKTTSDNLVLGDYVHYGDLELDKAYSRSVSTYLPIGLAGTYYVFVQTNADGRVLEDAFAANNITAAAEPIDIVNQPPDLVVTNASFAPVGGGGIVAGQPIRVDWTMRNSGGGPVAAGSWFTRIRLVADGPGGGEVVLADKSHNLPGFAAGAAVSFSESLTVPQGFAGTGTPVRLRIEVDAGGQVYESNESNNQTEATYTGNTNTNTITNPPPDLSVTRVGATHNGATLSVNWDVRNSGGLTPVSAWIDRVYVSSDAIFDADADALLAEVAHTTAVSFNGGYTASASNLALPAGLAGTVYVFVKADGSEPGFVGESNEANNVGYRAVTQVIVNNPGGGLPELADLQVTSISAASTLYSGQRATVNFTVNNLSSNYDASGRWYDSVYLSLDQFLDPGQDHLVGTFTRNGLAAGGSYGGAHQVTLPRGISGPYYLIAAVDRAGDVGETDESNNMLTTAATSLVELTPEADLVVDPALIVMPTFGFIAQGVTFDWSVRNTGGEALGAWADAVYLSQDDLWDAGDVKIGDAARSGPISSGASYDASLSAALPGVLPGLYHVIVVADIRDELREEPTLGQANNDSASLGSIRIDAQPITPGTPVTGTLREGAAAYYRVDLVAGQTVQLRFDSASTTGVNELYVGFNQVPSRGRYQFTAADPFIPDPTITFPAARTGTYYVLAYAADVGGTPSYTLSAELLPFSITGVSATALGQSGPFTLKIDGALFDGSTTFELLGPGNIQVAAEGIHLQDSVIAYATFNLSGLPEGEWTLRARRGDNSTATLGTPLSISAGDGGDLDARVAGPGAARGGRLNVFTVDYGNSGDVDIAPPLLIVYSDSATPFGPAPDDLAAGRQLQLLGSPQDGPLDRLRPNSAYHLPGFFLASTSRLHFQVRRITEGDRTPITNWKEIEGSIRPSGLGDEQWQAFWERIQPRIGATWGDYVRLLNRMQQMVARPGEPIHDVRALFAAVHNFDSDFTPSASFSGTLYNADSQAPMAGVKLMLYTSARNLAGSVTTDSAGRFTFNYLLDGSYTLAAAHPAFIDQDLNGETDAQPPVFTMSDGEDIEGLRVFASTTPPSAGRPGVDIAPAIATDSAGRAHMVWVRNDEIWHAVFNGTQWIDAAPIPDAKGSDLRIQWSDRLVDGSTPGLIVMYQHSQGNDAEIHYVIGTDDGAGAMKWSKPVALTSNTVNDNAPALLVDSGGRVITVYQRSNFEGNDDTDLYYNAFDIAAADLSFPVPAGPVALQFVPLGADPEQPAEFGVEVGLGESVKVNGTVPLIGWVNNIGALGTLLGVANNCVATAQGSIEAEFELMDDFKLKINGSGNATWKKNEETNQWEFSSGQAQASISGEAEIPVFWFFIPHIVGMAVVKVQGHAGGSINVSWDKDHPLSVEAAKKDATFNWGGGLIGEIEVLFGLAAEAKVSGIFDLATKVFDNFGEITAAQFKVEVEVTALSFIKIKKPWVWELCPPGASSPGAPAGTALAATIDSFTLPEGAVVTLEYTPGTGSVYGPNTVLADVSNDLFADGPASLAEGPGGQVLAAWAKDGDVAAGSFGSVVVSGFDGSNWSAPVSIPGSDGYNTDVNIGFDALGRAVATWRHADMTGISLSSSPEAAYNAAKNGRLVYAVRGLDGVWSSPMTDLDEAGDEYNVVMAEGAGGQLVLAWVASSPSGELLKASTWDGTSWSAPQLLATAGASGFASAPTISIVNGKSVVFWSQDGNDDPEANVVGLSYAVLSGGGWTAPQVFAPDSGYDFFAGVTVTESGGATAVAETGPADTITLVLNGPPTENVIVTFSTDQVAADRTTLTFTPENWNIPQAVNITAINDTAVEGQHTGTISFAVSSADARFDAGNPAAITVSIRDNEKGRVLITESGGRTDVSEDGISDTYQIVLLDQPDENVTIHIQSDADATLSPLAPIVFTPTDWNVPRTITVVAVDDADVEGRHQSIIRHRIVTSDPLYTDVAVRDVLANIIDNEDGRIVIAGGTGIQEEGQTHTTYTVRLADQPTAPVRVYLSIDDGQTGIVRVESLLFTPDDWDEPREVEIAAVDDHYDEGDWHNGRVRHLAESADPRYDDLAGPDFIASILDDDTAGVIIEPTDGETEVEEGGKTDLYFVRLRSAPFHPVVMNIYTDGQTTTTPVLVFTDVNWNVPQSVMVRAVDDVAFGEGRHLSAIRHEMTSEDPAYNGTVGAGAWVIDNEVGRPGVAIMQTDGRTDVQEAGHDDKIYVALTGRPSSSVTVTFTSLYGQANLSPSSVTFGPENWNEPQEITASADDDGDDDEGPHSDTFAINVFSGDPNFDDLEIGELIVYIADVISIEGTHGCITGSASAGGGGTGGPPPTEPCHDDEPPPYEPEPVFPADPNDILGPEGYGEQRWLSNRNFLEYTIRFENQPSATAPAQEVVITQDLDPDFDWRTFQLGDFGWADDYYQPAGPRPNLFRRIDLTATEGFYVDVSAGIDIATGTITWTFTTIDPLTGDQPLDARKGFLAVNDGTGVGEGFVKYRVRPRPDALTRSVLDAQATIVFDTEGPISTPPIANLLDSAAPVTSVTALPAVQLPGEFTVQWSGDDADGSGLSFFDVFVSIDGGAPALWLDNTTDTSATYTGELGRTYGFYSIGFDHVGNAESAPTSPDATTVIDDSAPTVVETVINDGSPQRSMVRSISFRFSEDVSPSISYDDLRLHNRTIGADVALLPDSFTYNAATYVATWSFADLPGGSLADGDYSATLLSSGITDIALTPLDGDDDDNSGGDYQLLFFRFLGDGDGDRDVDFADLFQFRQTYSKNTGQPLFNTAFDIDSDGDVDADDLAEFKINYQQILAVPIAPSPAAAAEPVNEGLAEAGEGEAAAGPAPEALREVKAPAVTTLVPDEPGLTDPAPAPVVPVTEQPASPKPAKGTATKLEKKRKPAKKKNARHKAKKEQQSKQHKPKKSTLFSRTKIRR